MKTISLRGCSDWQKEIRPFFSSIIIKINQVDKASKFYVSTSAPYPRLFQFVNVFNSRTKEERVILCQKVLLEIFSLPLYLDLWAAIS